MQLYTRLINEGIFIFWNDENVHDYNLKISIFNGSNKIKILDTTVSKGQCFYTLKDVGSGEYEIELNAFKDEKLIQTEVKKVKLASSAEGAVSLLDKLTEIRDGIDNMSSAIESELSIIEDIEQRVRNIFSSVDGVKYLLESPTRADAYDYATFIQKIIRAIR